MMDKYWLFERAEVKEQPFHSQLPLIGPFLAWFRRQWNNVSTTWYVRPLLSQQNKYNLLTAETLQDHESRLIAQDHDQVQTNRQVAELTLQLKQMNHRLQALEQRVMVLEENNPNPA